MRKKTSLKDIAQKVGVSTALVSYVVNNKDEEKRVGKEIAAKIREVAIELNYTVNQIARSLKTKKTHTIAFVVADINYRFTTGVINAIEAACQKIDYTVIYGSSDENPAKFAGLVSVLVNRQVDGLILVPVENCEAQIDFLNAHEIPFVLIDRILPNIEANIIAIDNEKAAYQNTQYLIKTGHRRIAFFSYQTHLIHLLDRKNGYLNALADAGINVDTELIVEISDNHSSIEVKKAIDKLLILSPKCDSIFFLTDTLAVDGLKYINSLHVKVPSRLGILSFDDAEAFELFNCPITHGSQPLGEIGRIAVNTLIDVMHHPKNRRKIFLEADFHIGRSCGEK